MRRIDRKLMQFGLLIRDWFEFGMHSQSVLFVRYTYYGNLRDAIQRAVQNEEITPYERNEYRILIIMIFNTIDFTLISLSYISCAENVFTLRNSKKRKRFTEHSHPIHWAH